MALSGSITTNGYDNGSSNVSNGRKYTLSWEITAQSVENNTSTLYWKISCAGGNDSWYAERTVKAVIDWDEVDPITLKHKTERIARYASSKIYSGSVTVPHKTNGTRSFSLSLQVAVVNSGINLKASNSFTINTIPRATTPTLSASSVDMGGSVTISMPRASSSFTHDLAYSFAGGSYVAIASGQGTSYKWTVPDLASKIPNATSGTVTVRCITKSGSATVGTKTVLLTAKVPTSVVPTISGVTLTEAVAGLAAQFGAFIQSKSKVTAAIAAAGAKGSTIKSYSTTFQGKTYTAASWTSGLLASSGTLSMVTTVTDSRGRTAKKTTSVTVLAYKPPQIAEFTAFRCDTSGNEQHDGTHAFITYCYTAPALNNGNVVTFTIQRKATAETEWETIHSGTATVADFSRIVAGFSADSQYDLRLTVKDWFGASTRYPCTVPTAAVIMDIFADGTGLGFGKVAEVSNLADFGLPVRFREGAVNNLLWSGAWYMTAGHTAELSQPISKQVSGVVLVFSEYADGAAADQSFHTKFVPKTAVAQHPGKGHCFQMTSSGLGYFATKYLHIYDTKIVGHDNNNITGVGACGITYTNNRFVLRYVIGV